MSLAVAVSAIFFRHTIPLGNFGFLAENRGQFFLDFFQKSVLGSPGNTLSKF